MALRSYLNGALFAEVYGGGAPEILALHGWGRRGRDFSESIEGLSAIALDLPGFGASPAPEQPMGAHGYADIVAGILEGFDRPPVLVGHSFGGRVAVCLAATHPEMVGSMVLTGVPLLRSRPPGPPGLAYRLVRRMHRLGLISDDRMEQFRRSRGSSDYRSATGVMRDILVKVVNETYEEEMSRIHQPVRLVWGAQDREVPPVIAGRAAEIFPSAVLEVLPGIGHMVPLQAPHALRAAIERVRA